jgi:hypothetical protein
VSAPSAPSSYVGPPAALRRTPVSEGPRFARAAAPAFLVAGCVAFAPGCAFDFAGADFVVAGAEAGGAASALVIVSEDAKRSGRAKRLLDPIPRGFALRKAGVK